MSIPHNSTHTNQVITYLRNGVSPIEISRALGITPGAVTQLMQSPEIASELNKIQAEQQARSSAIDARYDALEEKLLGQLEKTVPLLMRPMEITKVLSQINAAKRRGVAHAINSGPAQVLQLNIPISLQSKFIVNSANQVIQAGEQTLVTMQSGNIAGLASSTLSQLAGPIPVDPPQTIEANHDIITNSPEIEEEDEFGFTHKR